MGKESAAKRLRFQERRSQRRENKIRPRGAFRGRREEKAIVRKPRAVERARKTHQAPAPFIRYRNLFRVTSGGERKAGNRLRAVCHNLSQGKKFRHPGTKVIYRTGRRIMKTSSVEYPSCGETQECFRPARSRNGLWFVKEKIKRQRVAHVQTLSL